MLLVFRGWFSCFFFYFLSSMHKWEDLAELLSSLCPQGNTDLHDLLSDFQALSVGLKSHGSMIIVLKILNWIKWRFTYKNKTWNSRSICFYFALYSETFCMVYMKKYYTYRSLAGYSVSIYICGCVWILIALIYWIATEILAGSQLPTLLRSTLRWLLWI